VPGCLAMRAFSGILLAGFQPQGGHHALALSQMAEEEETKSTFYACMEPWSLITMPTAHRQKGLVHGLTN